MCFTKCPHFVVNANEFINNSGVHTEYKNLNGAFFAIDV
jgi:hypothetical protein